MSSCFATTFTSNETPPSGVGASCAGATPAASRLANAKGKIIETRRAFAPNPFVIDSSRCRRAAVLALRAVRWLKRPSGARRGAGTEVQVARNGSEVLLGPRYGRGRLTGLRRQDEVDRGRAVVAEHEADLAIVVLEPRGAVTGCRGCRYNRWRVSRRVWQRVTVPGEQHRLEQECEDTKTCRPAPRRLPSRSRTPTPI